LGEFKAVIKEAWQVDMSKASNVIAIGYGDTTEIAVRNGKAKFRTRLGIEGNKKVWEEKL